MKKKTITSMLVVTFLAMSLIGCSKKGEELITKDTIVEEEVVKEVTPVVDTEVEEAAEVVDPEVTEVVEPEVEEVTPAPTEEEEMITGKYNNFTKVISESTWTMPYPNVEDDLVYYADEAATITIDEDGLKSSGSFRGRISNEKWKNDWDYDSTFKYGETQWKYADSNGEIWEEERAQLTKDITKFGFDFGRFNVNKTEMSEDTITITGTYTVNTTANTVYEMLALEVLEAHEIAGDVNKVTADVTITFDLNTKSMEKVVLNYNTNGEVFANIDDETGDVESFVDAYTHTFTFE